MSASLLRRRLVRHRGDRAFGSLRVRNYRLYFAGQTLSSIGTWVQLVAEQWVVIRLGGGALALGVTTALQFMPLMVLGPYAGAVVDRADKRLLLTMTQSANGLLALSLGVLSLSGVLQIWMIWAAALLLGCVNSLDNAGRQALTKQLVGKELAANAASLNVAISNVARTVGPAIGGVLVAGTGYTACFLINAASYAIVVAALRAMRMAEFTSATAVPRRAGQVREGLRYVRGRPVLWIPILVLAVVSTFGMNYQVLIPVLVSSAYHLGANYYGLLMSVLGAGSAIGAFAAAGWGGPTARRVGLLASVFGLTCLGVAFAPGYGVAVPFIAALGIAHGLFLAACVGSLQISADETMLGRVMALYYMAFLGVSMFAGPLMGGIAQLAGVRPAFALAAVICLLVGTTPWLQARLQPTFSTQEHVDARTEQRAEAEQKEK